MLKKQPKTKVRGAIDKEAEDRQKNGVYGLFMMFLGAVIAVMIGVFLYLSPFFNKKTSPALNAPVEVVPLTKDSPPKDESAKKDEYRFYEILPKQEFESPPEGVSMQKPKPAQNKELAVDKVVKAPPQESDEIEVVEDETETYEGKIERTNPDSTYILQVRTYETAMEADQKRAEVMMAGVDAEVLKRYNDDGSVNYQVISTLMNTKDEANIAYQKLQSNGIDSVVVEQKH